MTRREVWRSSRAARGTRQSRAPVSRARVDCPPPPRRGGFTEVVVLSCAHSCSFFSREQSHDSSGPEKPRLGEIRGERTSSRSRGTSARAGSFGRVHREIRATDVLAARGPREYRARIFYRIPGVGVADLVDSATPVSFRLLRLRSHPRDHGHHLRPRERAPQASPTLATQISTTHV